MCFIVLWHWPVLPVTFCDSSEATCKEYQYINHIDLLWTINSHKKPYTTGCIYFEYTVPRAQYIIALQQYVTVGQ